MTSSESGVDSLHNPVSRAAAGYRPDIDGLRAIAVIAVVLYHYFPLIGPGGFLGVDIFFVLSGYLISTVILVDLSRGAFSFAGFYARRMRRIFPALALVLAFALTVGWYILTPVEWHDLIKNVLGGAGFVSNLLHASGDGYFNNPVTKAPLMHLWSLGMEEQFYLAWPLVLLILWKISDQGRRSGLVLGGILLIAGASFAYNVRMTHIDLERAFFSPLTRTWELLAGAVLARIVMVHGEIKSSVVRELSSASGVVLIAAGFAVVDESKRLPGWWTLLPVAGTVCLVWAGSQAWIHRRVLASRPLVAIGLISYPLYLWHWPLLVFFKIVQPGSFGFGAQVELAAKSLLLVLGVALSWATYKLVEVPMRFSPTLSPALRVKVLFSAMSLVAVMAALGYGPLEPRLHSAKVRELERAKTDIVWIGNWKSSPLQTFEVPSSDLARATLLVGDSHMEQYIPRARAAIEANPHLATAVFATSGACAPLPEINNAEPGYRCPAFYDYWNALAKQDRFSTIAIAASWNRYGASSYRVPATYHGRRATAADFDEAWARLATDLYTLIAAGKRVVIFEDNPTGIALDPEEALGRLGFLGFTQLSGVPRATVEADQELDTRRLRELQRRTSSEILPVRDYLCTPQECPAVDARGVPLYIDDSHLRKSTVEKMATYFDAVLKP